MNTFNRKILRSALCLILASLLDRPLLAAPPAITYLNPSGAQQGKTVDVAVAGSFSSWPVQVWTSHKGITAKAGKDKGKLTVSVSPDVVPGTHWLRLHDKDGASSMRPFIVGTLPEILEQGSNDTTEKPQVVARSSIVNGQLEKSGDVDVFSIECKKGQTLVASLEANGTLRSPMDAILQIVSDDGFVLEQNNDWTGLDPRIAYRVPKDGKYLVRLFAFPSAPDSSIRFSGAASYIYRLTITTQAFAEYAQPLAMRRDSKGPVALEGWNLPPSLKPVPSIVGDDLATASSPLLGNAIQVMLVDHAVSLGIPSEPTTPPFSVSGRLEKPGTPDRIRFKAKKGQSLTLRVDSREIGLMVNPVIRVLDSEEKQLARAEPRGINKDVEVKFAAKTDGIYLFEVQDLHGGSGTRFAYLASATIDGPDFTLAVAGDRFAIAPGKTLDLPVTTTRTGGFSKEIQLKMEGLPEGVKFEQLPAAKKDLKSVTLRLTASDKAVSGAFRIVGHSSEPKLARTAKAPLADFATTTSDLWIAVGGEVPAAKAKKKR